jgi:peptidoglycan/LPS O-acetylase OafA/YrhL
MTGERNAWLDTLRATAILTVVACHISSSFRELNASHDYRCLAVAGLGGHGVDLFFVLSGWLLGCLLLSEKTRTNTIDVKRFLTRRWLRTLPAYYTVLFLTIGQRVLQDRWQVGDGYYILFIQNYLFDPLPFFGVSWSLCVEEQFYLLIAPLLLLLPTRGLVTSALACLVVLPMVVRWLVAAPYPWLTHLRIDGCALGVLMAHLFLNYSDCWKRVQTWASYAIPVGLVILVFAGVQRYRGEGGDLPLTFYYLLSGCLVVQSQASDFWKRRATNSLLIYIATRSYSLYLVHIDALAIARRVNDDHFLIYGSICILVSLLLAELLFRLVEQPWMTYRDCGEGNTLAKLDGHHGSKQPIPSSIP